MKNSEFKPTTAQIRKYFESRFPGVSFKSKAEQKVICCFHQESTPSLALNFDKGTFHCFGCGVEGGMIDFEMKFTSTDHDTARNNIAEIIGNKQIFMAGEKPQAVYEYKDATGKLVFQKLRYPGKRFVSRQPNGKGGWEYHITVANKPLYRLPEVLTCDVIGIAGGEKDCDNLVEAFRGSEGFRFTATTNFDGEGKWDDRYSVYFAGKRVVVFSDNDEIGRKHTERVAASVHPYALEVRTVHFPELPPKADVSDYLASHTANELKSRIKSAARWFPVKKESKYFESLVDFCNAEPEEIKWVVDGLIQEGANGICGADPKVGKSYLCTDLAISLAMGAQWMGMKIKRPYRVALISREDAPGLTRWRASRLARGKESGDIGVLADNCVINTKNHSPDYKVDIDDIYREVNAELKEKNIEFAIFDVFNRLHCADENDNKEMVEVLAKFTAIQAEVGCQILILHHFNKSDGYSLVKKLRGSSAVAGWAEWVMGITVDNPSEHPNDWVRRLEFEAKADVPPDPIYYRIVAPKESSVARMVIDSNYGSQQEMAKRSKGKSKADKLME